MPTKVDSGEGEPQLPLCRLLATDGYEAYLAWLRDQGCLTSGGNNNNYARPQHVRLHYVQQGSLAMQKIRDHEKRKKEARGLPLKGGAAGGESTSASAKGEGGAIRDRGMRKRKKEEAAGGESTSKREGGAPDVVRQPPEKRKRVRDGVDGALPQPQRAAAMSRTQNVVHVPYRMMGPWGMYPRVPQGVPAHAPPGMSYGHAPQPPGFHCHHITLMLPPPGQKLGLILDTNKEFGLTELKDVAMDSPIRSQIPAWLHRGCCIQSLDSEATGHVRGPKTREECAALIGRAREGATEPVRMEVTLMEMRQRLPSHLPPMVPHAMPPWGQYRRHPPPPVPNAAAGTAPAFDRHLIKLTLPPPVRKLGLTLDDSAAFGLPVLRDVAANSPVRAQIPATLHRGCGIGMLKSKAIGQVHPRTAHECAMLIAKSHEEDLTLEIALMLPTKGARKTHHAYGMPATSKKAEIIPMAEIMAMDPSTAEWDKESDAQLAEMVRKAKRPNWNAVAKQLGRDKTPRDCEDRWNFHLKPGARKGGWTEQEDAIIIETVEKSPEGELYTRWSDLALKLPGRHGKQCRDRWVNHLNPAIDRSELTREDDLKLWNAHGEVGSRWVEISSTYFEGARSENQLKNRFMSAKYRRFIAKEFGKGAYAERMNKKLASSARRPSIT